MSRIALLRLMCGFSSAVVWICLSLFLMVACVTEPIEPTPEPTPDAPGVAWGTYKLSWACLEGCTYDSPLRHQDRLTIDNQGVVFWRSSCGPSTVCNAIYAKHEFAMECLLVDIDILDAQFALCSDMIGIISYYGYPNPAARKTWEFIGYTLSDV